MKLNCHTWSFGAGVVELGEIEASQHFLSGLFLLCMLFSLSDLQPVLIGAS